MPQAQRLIYEVGGPQGYDCWMEGTGRAKRLEDTDLVVFTGGADINPELYGRERHPKTYFNAERDVYEVQLYEQAKALKKPMIGICRGAQLMCALNNGELIQHQDDPVPFHEVTTKDGKHLTMTSLHHQACWPWMMHKDEYEVIGWTQGNSSFHELTRHKSGIDALFPQEPCFNREVEIITFPKARCLGIQGHPEMMYHRTGYSSAIRESIEYCRFLLNNLINHE